MLLPSNSKYRAKVSRKSDSVTLLLLVFKLSLNKLAGKHKARPWRTGKHTDQVSGDLAETEFILSEAGTETKLAKATWGSLQLGRLLEHHWSSLWIRDSLRWPLGQPLHPGQAVAPSSVSTQTTTGTHIHTHSFQCQ